MGTPIPVSKEFEGQPKMLHTKVEAAYSPDIVTKLPPLKVVLASPTYGTVDPIAAKSIRIATWHAQAMGISWLGEVSTDRMGFDSARNTSAKEAIDSGADGVVWVDSDMIIPTDGISRLLCYDKDFVSGVYFQRGMPHWPLVYMYDPEVDSFRHTLKWPQGMCFPADAVGFGFCYTSTKMLKHMREHPEVKEKGWFGLLGKFSEDLSMCRRAGQMGYKVHVDTAILCGHIANPQIVTLETFKATNPYQEGTGDPLVESAFAVSKEAVKATE
jgi:hypothetical protein